MRYLRVFSGVPHGEVSLEQLRTENPDTSFGTDPAEAILEDWDVFYLTDPGAPLEYSTTDYALISGNWTIVYAPLTAAETALSRSRQALSDFRSKLLEGLVVPVVGGTFLLGTSNNQIEALRADADAGGNVDRVMIAVAALVVTLTPVTLNGAETAEILEAVEDYVRSCTKALQDCWLSIAGGSPDLFEVFWAAETGSPVTGLDLLHDAGLAGDAIASLTAQYE